MIYLIPLIPAFIVACFIWPALWLVVLALAALYILIVNGIIR